LRASKRAAKSLMASIRVFTKAPFHTQSYEIRCNLSVEDYTMPELELRGDTPEPLISRLKALNVLLLVAEKTNHEARGI
jgi:hypothetical protein